MDINQKEAVTYMEKNFLNHKHDEKCGCSPPKKSLIVADNAKLEQIKGKKPLFLIGFPGVGMLGNIISSEFIKQLNMKQIGFVDSEDLPAIAVVYDGIIHHPFRLFYSQEKNIVVAQCEIPFNKSSTLLSIYKMSPRVGNITSPYPSANPVWRPSGRYDDPWSPDITIFT